MIKNNVYSKIHLVITSCNPTFFMKYISLLTLTFLCLSLQSCASQKAIIHDAAPKVNQTMTDKKGKTHLIGKSTCDALKQNPFDEWYKKNFDAYELKTDLINKSKGKTNGISVQVFMATWCGDSKRHVPVFYKVMDAVGIAEDSIELINVYRGDDKYKQSPTHEEQGLNIHRVPTFIFYKGGEEIGRIVESPMTNMETDVAQILNEMPSKPRYIIAAHFNTIFKEKKQNKVREKMEAYGKYVKRYASSLSELNTYGYVLIDQGNIDDALLVFELNTLAYPDSYRVYDSLGEAHMKKGNTELAIKNYNKVLELNPKDENAPKMLKKIKKG